MNKEDAHCRPHQFPNSSLHFSTVPPYCTPACTALPLSTSQTVRTKGRDPRPQPTNHIGTVSSLGHCTTTLSTFENFHFRQIAKSENMRGNDHCFKICQNMNYLEIVHILAYFDGSSPNLPTCPDPPTDRQSSPDCQNPVKTIKIPAMRRLLQMGFIDSC